MLVNFFVFLFEELVSQVPVCNLLCLCALCFCPLFTGVMLEREYYLKRFISRWVLDKEVAVGFLQGF